MDDLTQKLNDLLNSPDSMQKIQAALSSLGADSDDDDNGDEQTPTLADQLPDSETLSSLLSAFASGQSAPAPAARSKKDKMVVRPKKDAGSGMPDLTMLTKLIPLMASMNQDDDDTNLLKALRPYLRGDREKRLDDAIKILRLMKLMPLLQDKGLF